MRSPKLFALVSVVVGMVSSLCLSQVADAAASSRSRTAKTSKAASPCKKPKRHATRRSATRASAGTARRHKTKCKKVVLRRTYRGKTSQGEPIVIKTFNFRKKVDELGTYVPRVCGSPGYANFTASDRFEMLFPVRLRGTAFSAPLPSYDSEFLVKGMVAGHAGRSTATGQGNIPAGGDSGDTCDAATFSFSIPKVHEVRGIRPIF